MKDPWVLKLLLRWCDQPERGGLEKGESEAALGRRECFGGCSY